MPYTVVADGIRKSYGGQVVLDGVDLAIEQGSVFALLGPNGAGKSTMVRILATLVRPDAGTAVIAGRDLLRDPVGVKRAISLTGQFAAVDDVLTGRENLEMMARLRHLPRRAIRSRADELLAEFDLLDARDRRVRTYSGGMRRRLDLAVSLIEKPALAFLDEPTTGLDPRSREQLWGTVRRLVDDGVTILLTTQYLEEADQLADTVAMLSGGRIVARGTPDELKSSLGAEVVRLRFADPAGYRGALGRVDATRTDERLHTIEVATDGSAAEIHAILGRLTAAGTPASKVSTHRPSLDDVFMLCAGFGAGTTAVALATDMTNGIVDRFRSMPINGSSILIGQIVASLARNLIATTLVIGVGLAVGWRPTTSVPKWIAAVAMITLFVFALSWLAAAVGLVARGAEAANSFTFVLMFVPYVSTAFVPARTMPAVLRGFAEHQPFTPIIETMRGLWMGHTSTGVPLGHEAWIAVAYCLGIGVLSAAASSYLFRHRTAG